MSHSENERESHEMDALRVEDAAGLMDGPEVDEVRAISVIDGGPITQIDGVVRHADLRFPFPFPCVPYGSRAPGNTSASVLA
jgi:hypothetical protein